MSPSRSRTRRVHFFVRPSVLALIICVVAVACSNQPGDASPVSTANDPWLVADAAIESEAAERYEEFSARAIPSNAENCTQLAYAFNIHRDRDNPWSIHWVETLEQAVDRLGRARAENNPLEAAACESILLEMEQISAETQEIWKEIVDAFDDSPVDW